MMTKMLKTKVIVILKEVCLKWPLERDHRWSRSYVDGQCVPCRSSSNVSRI